MTTTSSDLTELTSKKTYTSSKVNNTKRYTITINDYGNPGGAVSVIFVSGDGLAFN